MRHAAAWTLARQSLNAGRATALITVVAVKGSAPREPGACMSVTAEQTAGTVGGGTLEWRAIESARALLQSDITWQHQQLGLGPALGQCCGGRVELLIERLDEQDLQWLNTVLDKRINTGLHSTLRPGCRTKQLRHDGNTEVHFEATHSGGFEFNQPTQPGHFHLLLFGGGHVGQALLPLLSNLPCTLHWVDSREHTLPPSRPPQLHSEWLEAPTLALQDAPQGSLVMVMTHNHALDFEITAAALNTPAVRWVGMIGSANKRRQLDHYLAKRNLSTTAHRLACPIGQRHADLRDPAELAIVLAGEILSARAVPQLQITETLQHA